MSKSKNPYYDPDPRYMSTLLSQGTTYKQDEFKLDTQRTDTSRSHATARGSKHGQKGDKFNMVAFPRTRYQGTQARTTHRACTRCCSVDCALLAGFVLALTVPPLAESFNEIEKREIKQNPGPKPEVSHTVGPVLTPRAPV
jgi:hypothetical protein